jgi:hypothetical protein
MADYYVDAIPSTTAQADGPPRYSTPMPLSTEVVVLEQDFVVVESGYTPPSVGTAHPSATSYLLASEGPRTPLGGGVIKFTRTYCKKPTDYSTYESYAMAFIQFQTSGGIIRLAANFVVTSRIEHKFYRISASGGDYTAVSSIPIVEKFFPTRDISGQTSYFTIANDDTTPTGDAYVADYIDTLEIAAEASQVSHWMGQIWVRKTRYVTAK